MKLLVLTDGNYTVVDDEDYERLSQYNWHSTIEGTIRRTYSNGLKNKNVAIANEIMRRFDCLFDHKDQDKKNNQKSNLREATRSQNNYNQKKRIGNFTSKHKGVSWNKKCKKWSAIIYSDGVCTNIGLFETEKEAAEAYNVAAELFHKEFAVFNRLEQETVIQKN